MGVEIERKFLLDKLPKGYTKLEHFEIDQGYFKTKERLRRILRTNGRVEYWYETKNGNGIGKPENKHRIYRATFDTSWEKTKRRRLAKTRYLKPDPQPNSALVFEIDQFRGKLKGYIVEGKLKPYLQVEVEFRSLRAALRFSPPGWFGREVTGIKEHTNRSLATNGLPPLRK